MDQNEKRQERDQPRALRRRALEAAILKHIEGRREFMTGDLRDLANLAMVRARLKAMANRGVIVRLARDQWINDSRLSERESSTIRRSVAARKASSHTNHANRPRGAAAGRSGPVVVRRAEDLSPEERTLFGFDIGRTQRYRDV